MHSKINNSPVSKAEWFKEVVYIGFSEWIERQYHVLLTILFEIMIKLKTMLIYPGSNNNSYRDGTCVDT